MTRATAVRAVLALAVVAASLFLALTVSPRLGLDLRGGTQIVLETRDSPTAQADRDATDRTLEVLRRRVDALGVTEPDITRSGDNRILVELPGVQDPREAAKVLGRTAQLTFHPVEGLATEEQRKSAGRHPDGTARVLPDESGGPLLLGPAALTGAEIAGAEAQLDTQRGAGWFVTVDLGGSGESAWTELTAEAACAPSGDPTRRAAIVLDGEVISSPEVDSSVRCGTGITGDATQITGRFDQSEARDLALLINGGALPVPVETVEQRTVGPTLGAEAIEASTWAALIGTALTSLFVIYVYRLLGGLAALALACYGLVSYAALLALGATLTLPGLAGFVLAIGMAVDANVLVFERAREEYTSGRRGSLRSASATGFRKALSAVADSNVTTLLAAGLLFLLASGPVRGFGVTLSIGVVASMFSALVIARALAEVAVARPSLRRRPHWSGIAHPGRVRSWLARRSPDVMRHRRRWLAGSALLVVLAGSGIVVQGVNLGVEFTGGRMVEYTTARQVDPETAREAVADAGQPDAVVRSSGDGALSVRTKELTNDEEAEVRAALAEVGGETEKVRDELIGPSLGDELRRNALIALGVALLAQLTYLAVRFRWMFGLAAVVSLAHDVVIVVGIFAWLGKPVDGVFLAALLTVIGYSVNDSVVVFDRVRELTDTAERRTPFARIANSAVLQTVPRTVNTGMGAVFILASLALLGGDTLTDFALALLLGVVVGTCSSVLTAVPLAVTLEGRSGGDPERARSSGDGRTRRPAERGRRGRDPYDNGARV